MIRLYGSAYLNLQNNLEYIRLLYDSIKKYGVNNPVSRLSSFTHCELYEDVERLLANEFLSKAACVMPNGYLSGCVTRNALYEIAKKNNYILIYDENGHPCYLPKTYPESVNYSEIDCQSGIILFINSINSFYGCIDETYNLTLLKNIKIVAFDISHSAHILNHSYLLRQLNDNVEFVFFGSLGKASAFSSGFVAGNCEIIEYIKQQPEYCAATPPSIAGADTYIKSANLRKQFKQHLLFLMDIFEKGIGVEKNEIDIRFPVYNIKNGNSDVYEELLSYGYESSFMSYPHPESTKHLRIIINAGLNELQIKKLVSFLHTKNIEVQSYCFKNNIEVLIENPSNKALHQTTIPQLSAGNKL